MSAVTVVIADDQTVVREGLRAMLEHVPALVVQDAVASGEELVALVTSSAPDVALTDLRMPGIGGIEAIRRIREAQLPTRCVALTTYDDPETISSAMSAGAFGFLNKDADPDTIETVVRAAAAGRALLDDHVLSALVHPARPDSAAPPSADRLGLTPRETEVLRCVAAGRSNQQICRDLVISMATVKTHINHLMAKTQSRDRAALVSWAYEHHLMHP